MLEVGTVKHTTKNKIKTCNHYLACVYLNKMYVRVDKKNEWKREIKCKRPAPSRRMNESCNYREVPTYSLIPKWT